MTKYIWIVEEDYKLEDGTEHISSTYYSTKKAALRNMRDIERIGKSNNMFFATDIFDNLVLIKRQIVHQ